MAYGIHERDYLDRAKARIEEGTQEAMFYAAMELRCAVEGRQDSYTKAQRRYLKSVPKVAWKIRDQGRDLQRVYSGELIQRLRITFESGEELELFHVPVSNRLRQAVSNIDQYRHAQVKFRPDTDAWWTAFADRLLKLYRMTWPVLQGTLLSPAIITTDKVTGKRTVDMMGEMTTTSPIPGLVGKQSLINVTYLDAPPAEWTCDL
jgi:hypothetical protein